MSEVAERTKTWTENRGRLQYVLQNYGLWFVIVLLLIVAGAVTPGFLQPDNIMTLLRQASFLGIVVIGQLFVILISGLDLSVGQLISMTTVVAGRIAMGDPSREPMGIGIVIALALGTGFVNGIIIAKRRVEPFIMTLATMVILQGYHWNYSKGANIGYVSENFRGIAIGFAGPVPAPVLIWIAIIAIAAVVLYKTPFGRHVYAIGGNREAARLSGVNVDLVTVICYIVCSLCALLVGIILLGYISVGDSRAGQGYELGSIAAVVVGGASLAGGRGTMDGTAAGVLLLTIISSILIGFGLPWFANLIVRGVIIIGAVAWYVRTRARRA
jgi:ribose/xylose/arabinose/galactoside ABC-type transport system permease subunit